MCYNVGKEVQTLNLGIDTGTSNIGVSVTTNEGKELLSSTFKTNTLKIKEVMEKRLSHRRTRTRFKRDKKKRRAIANNTHFKG
jgi:Holliday junction resolvasome RuvABC endonuclease subunit